MRKQELLLLCQKYLIGAILNERKRNQTFNHRQGRCHIEYTFKRKGCGTSQGQRRVDGCGSEKDCCEMKNMETFYGMDKSYEEILDFEKPKYIYVDGIKLEVEKIIVGHTELYGYDEKDNRICKEFTTRMWIVKEEIQLDISKFHVLDDGEDQYICYISENRKALIETGD